MDTLTVTFGNVAPHQADKYKVESLSMTNPDPRLMIPLDPTLSHTTTVHAPLEWSNDKIVAECVQLWPHHSAYSPSWVTIFGDRSDAAVQELEIKLRVALGMPPKLDVPTMLLTNAGLDFVAKQMAGAASATAVAKWIALTANAAAPAAGDTALTGEIVTAGGGLIRVAAAYAHTGAATTYTLTNTFTANGNDTLPVTIAKAGCFDDAAAGNMPFETLLSATATLTASGDNIPLTWTITL